MTGLSEDDLIADFFAPHAGPGGLGLKDDAAVVRPISGYDLVITTDAIVAGVHFFPTDPPASIARKALGVNLSDLAAKGAAPMGFVLTLGLPTDWSRAWLAAFAAALGAAAEAGACSLLGGDTVHVPGPLTLSITAFGSVPQGRMVKRTGARPGDRLFVSGTIGDAALGLACRAAEIDSGASASDADSRYLVDRYLHPRPRAGLASALLAHANGGMDVSDGLVGDITKMLRASGVGGRIELAAVPLSEAIRRRLKTDPSVLTTVLTGGDDYEVLASIPDTAASAFVLAAAEAGVSVTPIGVVSADPAIEFLDEAGRPRSFEKGSYQHF